MRFKNPHVPKRSANIFTQTLEVLRHLRSPCANLSTIRKLGKEAVMRTHCQRDKPRSLRLSKLAESASLPSLLALLLASAALTASHSDNAIEVRAREMLARLFYLHITGFPPLMKMTVRLRPMDPAGLSPAEGDFRIARIHLAANRGFAIFRPVWPPGEAKECPEGHHGAGTRSHARLRLSPSPDRK